MNLLFVVDKGYIIKEYFANYLLHNSDVTINLQDRSIDMHANNSEPWKVTLIDTGEETLTAGRLKKLYPYLKNEKQFFFHIWRWFERYKL